MPVARLVDAENYTFGRRSLQYRRGSVVVMFRRCGTGWLDCAGGEPFAGTGVEINFSRRRPYLADDNVHLSHHPLRDYSFPSGHATAVFTLATILSLTFPWFSLLLIPLSGAVGISRIYLGLHYPTDVVGGAVIGMAFAIGTHLLT